MMFYFGKYKSSEHALIRPDGSPVSVRHQDCPFRAIDIDGTYCPNVEMFDGQPYSYTTDEQYQVQSECRLTHVVPAAADVWTILACWDRTGDQRFSSNSAFVAKGEKTFQETIVLAHVHFPEIVERIERAATMHLVEGHTNVHGKKP